ncbi:type IA DNA topoisomerase [Paenibacillus sp. J2TS4]|uniref:type IA DNA topoisomerase n=1 Tax=Paenibacillus sp. J2TS4 TaxID=2807194 RepID=UPI001B29E9F5|nr:type IA DNA topoisomerase [Paenibacillus sp. J2TS4]GIP34679.1 DNA topoisomerase [Paenibacillus sp. J2TS4]
MKTLVIAEKPDMGRNIARAIEPKAVNKKTHLEGERYIITWAIGHLVGLAEPDKYDDRYKKWRIEDLPIIPDSFKLVAYYKTRSQLKVISELAKQCSAIINACDAGREGQHIFALIQRHLKLRHPVQRLWISDLTPETIRHGFANLKDGSEFDNLTKAARARSEADWLVGMNGSRAFTTKHRELLSVGRVQTPVLALIYDREKQIEAFSSLTYYDVEASFSQENTNYSGKWQGERITDRKQAEAIAAKVKGQTGKIASYEAKDTREYPYKLYDLTLLQREANGKYGFTAKKTLDLAQSLYEKHKVITYPRTNSNYVTEQNIAEMHRALTSLQGTSYDSLVQQASRSFVHKNNRYVCNPAKVEDHHAILPTAKKAGSLSADEQKLYDMIVRRFLSHFYPPAQYKVHTVLTEVEKELFKTTIKQLLDLGWKIVYSGSEDGKKNSRRNKEEENEEVETDESFSVDKALEVLCTGSAVQEKETQPPKPFTEGTLLKAMESAGKQIEDEELREAIKDSGLGTPATRASTIERLKQVGYIGMQGKRIALTPKGRSAVELIRGAGIELLTSPEMTGQWERRLNEIARGQASDTAFMEKVKEFTVHIVNKVRSQPQADQAAFAQPEAPAKGRSRAAGGTRRRTAAGASAGTAGARPAATRAAAGEAAAKPGNARGGAGTRTAAGASGAQAAARAGGAAKSSAGVIGLCPRPGCGGTIFMGSKGYGCSNYKHGCGFVIWKKSKFGKTLSDTMVKSLIQKGSTNKLKFKSSSGQSYEGKLILADRNTGDLGMERVF